MIFDLAVLSVLLISAGVAFWRGLIREVLTIVGVLGGLVAMYFLGPPLTPVTRDLLGVREGEEPQLFMDAVPYTIIADALAYGGVFLVVVILLTVWSHFLASGARAVGLGALDRSLGVIFGLARGVLILTLLYLPVYMLVEKETRQEWQWLEESRTRVYVEATAAWIAGMIPESLLERSEEQVESAREKLQEMDVLRRDGAPAEEKAAPARDADGAVPGYRDEQRQDMRDLIEENINE